MNPVTIVVGALFCAYAGYVLTVRLQGRDDKFRKLGAMRRFWGVRLGSGIHYFGYVVVPLMLGLALVWAGLRGASPFSAF